MRWPGDADGGIKQLIPPLYFIFFVLKLKKIRE